ncbi:MAG: hypothetical protein ABIJ18_00405 [archaeon]
MRGDFLKSKAIFMTFLIIASIFTVYNIKLVTAEDETNYCCEKTTDGEYCRYTSPSECDSAYSSAAVTCEQTSFCEGGCCISDEGKCSKNVPKSVCENTEGYSWGEGAECDIAACEKQCCTVADSICSYTTAANCEVIDSGYPEVEAEFVDVGSELECVDICTESNKGCCVSPDGCEYTTKGMCENAEINLEGGTGFYDNRYCSDLNLCGCVEHFEKRCVNEDVYWFDSCGNQEEVAEDCDYTRGSWCGTDEVGEAYCKDVNCETSFDGIYNIEGANVKNVHDSTLGDAKQHGESWCLYEGPAGDYLDRPGSQHYRTYCYFGEQVIEPCRDYREEICLQYPMGSEDGERGSACLDNDIYEESLIQTEVSTVPTGNKFWSESQEVSTCSEGSVSCDVVFVKESRTATKWKCAENCECLSDYWMINASKWCSSKGDCGANFNILEQFSDDGFYMTRSQDTLEANDQYTAIAYDLLCEYEYNSPVYGEIGALCANSCTGFDNAPQAIAASMLTGIPHQVGSLPSCAYFNSLNQTSWYTGHYDGDERRLDEEYLHDGQNMKDAYGVHGGLLAMSEVIGTFDLQGIADAWLSDYQKGGQIVAVIAGAFAASIILTAYIVGTAIGVTGTVAALGAGFMLTPAVVGTAVATQISTAITTTTTAAAASAAIQPVATATISAASAGPVGFVVALVLVVIVILTLIFTSGGETTTITVTANCEGWQPPTGGEFCELCDIPVSEGGLAIDDGYGNVLPGYECTEYKCKSLGAACEYITENSGTDREKCYNAHVNDVNHPVITPNTEIFDLYGYDYEQTSDRFIEVFDIEPYTKFNFGIITDELAQCKIDTNLPDDYDSMLELFPDSYYSKSKNQTRVLVPEEEVNYYIRCQDLNGNYNIDAFTFKVHALAGEDLQAPIIKATDIASGSFVANDVTQPVVTVFTNEPAQCKWSTGDQDYDIMDQWMLCSGSSLASQTVYFDYSCTAALNITHPETNYYYFACEDNNGNQNSDTYAFTLQGSEQLNIDRVSPNGTLYYDDVALQVYTAVGAQDGKAVCYYNNIAFFTTNNTYHEQLFTGLSESSYSYDILCQDVAGNQNETIISFTVDVDESAPELIEIYQKENTLYFTTDETSTCEYYYEDFDFGEGLNTEGTIAMADATTYYIKCEDEFGNEGTFIIEV